MFSVETSDSLASEIALVRPQRLVYIESFPITLLSSLLLPTLLLQICVRGGGESTIKSIHKIKTTFYLCVTC